MRGTDEMGWDGEIFGRIEFSAALWARVRFSLTRRAQALMKFMVKWRKIYEPLFKNNEIFCHSLDIENASTRESIEHNVYKARSNSQLPIFKGSVSSAF